MAARELAGVLPSGAEVLIPNNGYGGLRSLGEEFMPERGVTLRAVDMTDVERTRCHFEKTQ